MAKPAGFCILKTSVKKFGAARPFFLMLPS